MKKNRTLVYCRESRDDYGLDYERIETQRDLLLRYCRENDLAVVDIIMDDDETGTNFNRYEEVKKRVLNKEFDIILFKNSARLGRNQKESLIFADFLEEHGIEIRFEDERYDEESFGLFAWFNERRARDDSKNIRRNLREKIEQGKLIVKPIYGYEVFEKRLVVNEKTAEVVQLIFDLYVNKEWGYSKIAKYLNTLSYKTPSQERNYTKTLKTNIWGIQHIKRIVKDIRYTGCYLGGTTEKVSFKSKKTRKKSREEWVTIPNMHKPLISMELWERACKLNDERNKKVKIVDKGDNIFSGVLYCGKCGSPMYRRRAKNRKDIYLCKKYWREGKVIGESRWGCTAHNTKSELIGTIIKSLINKLLNTEEIKKYILTNVKYCDTDKTVLEKKLEKVNEQKQNIYIKLGKIYDDKLNGIIPEFLFVTKSNELNKELKEVENNIEMIVDKLNMLNSIHNNEEVVCKAIENVKQNGLTRDELKKLIKKIVIFEINEIQKSNKENYSLSDKIYTEILEKGGILIITTCGYKDYIVQE